MECRCAGIELLIAQNRYFSKEEQAELEAQGQSLPGNEYTTESTAHIEKVPPSQEEEKDVDDFSDIDLDAVRKQLANGEESPFVKQVIADVERAAAQHSPHML